LVDGTYEIFRQYHAKRPGHLDASGMEVGAARSVVSSVLNILEDGATHVGVATDRVIESFRNELWDTYKTSEGMPPDLLAQFGVLDDALASLGVAVWSMIEFEADDALGTAARVAAADKRVERVIICTPDKDLGQCVGGKVVQLDRRQDKLLDAAAVEEKFGVPPASIPDWLALVGDSADGFPGLPGFGAKTAAALLTRYEHLEAIPDDPRQWDVPSVRNPDKLAATLQAGRRVADLFKVLATLRDDVPVGTVDEWEWRGPRDDFAAWADRFGMPNLVVRTNRLLKVRAPQSQSKS
jgi:5'-3' exonuclease